MAGGRPTIYTAEIAVRICEHIATSSKSLKTICKEDDMPSVGSILSWLNTNPEFLSQYTRAKEQQADYLAEEMIDIADDGSNDTMHTAKGDFEDKEWTSRSKLRVETRKWIASKLKPKKYGDKLDLTTDGGKLPGAQILTLPTDKLRQIEQLLSHETTADNKENAAGDTQGAI